MAETLEEKTAPVLRYSKKNKIFTMNLQPIPRLKKEKDP